MDWGGQAGCSGGSGPEESGQERTEADKRRLARSRVGPGSTDPGAGLGGQGQPPHTPLEALPAVRPSPLAMVQPFTGKQLLDALRSMLRTTIPDLEAVLDQFGQVRAVERRADGEQFSLKDHVRGLLLALLSNQRPWLPIARAMEQIEGALLGFDPDALEHAAPSELMARLVELRCGGSRRHVPRRYGLDPGRPLPGRERLHERTRYAFLTLRSPELQSHLHRRPGLRAVHAHRTLRARARVKGPRLSRAPLPRAPA